MNLNEVKLVGRLTKNVEISTTGTGKKYARITIAIDEGYGDNKKTLFIPVTVWEKQAEFLNQYGGKGTTIMVDGRITTRQVERDGKKFNELGVAANNVQIEFKQKPANAQPQPAQQAQPVQNYAQQGFTPADGAGESYDINDLI